MRNILLITALLLILVTGCSKTENLVSNNPVEPYIPTIKYQSPVPLVNFNDSNMSLMLDTIKISRPKEIIIRIKYKLNKNYERLKLTARNGVNYKFFDLFVYRNENGDTTFTRPSNDYSCQFLLESGGFSDSTEYLKIESLTISQ